MDVVQLLLGIGLVAVRALAWRIALPREGQVRPFLRNDHAQAYFSIFILVTFVFGVVNIIAALVP